MRRLAQLMYEYHSRAITYHECKASLWTSRWHRWRGVLLLGSLLPLCGCQAAAYAFIVVGMDLVGDAVGISSSIKDNIRDATGGCVTWYFKSIPCPEKPKP